MRPLRSFFTTKWHGAGQKPCKINTFKRFRNIHRNEMLCQNVVTNQETKDGTMVVPGLGGR